MNLLLYMIWKECRDNAVSQQDQYATLIEKFLFFIFNGKYFVEFKEHSSAVTKISGGFFVDSCQWIYNNNEWKQWYSVVVWRSFQVSITH